MLRKLRSLCHVRPQWLHAISAISGLGYEIDGEAIIVLASW